MNNITVSALILFITILFTACNPSQKNQVNNTTTLLSENSLSKEEQEALDSLIISKMWTDEDFRKNTTNRFRSLAEAYKNPDSVVNLAVYSGFKGIIPENIDTFRNVQLIGMERNNLSKLPESIGKLEYLQIVHLNKNHFNEFPMVLTKNRYLKTILISDNQIEKIPHEITNLVYLENLVLNDNKIGYFPSEFFNLRNLKVLGLSNNGINELPDSFNYLPNLEKLNLQGNNLTALPETLTNLKTLKRLTLKNNPLDPKMIDELQKLLPDTKIEF